MTVQSPFAVHRNYRLRHVHVADIKEPLVKAVWYWRYAQRVSSDAGSMPRDPENRAAWSDLVEEVQYATKRCNDILADLHKNRKLERGSINPDVVAA